jgi:hypothetical protein
MEQQPKKKGGFWRFMKELATIVIPELIKRIKISKRR